MHRGRKAAAVQVVRRSCARQTLHPPSFHPPPHPQPRQQINPHLQRPPPVLVMAHGIGAQKDVGLATYAQKFGRRALAVVLFDYRSFGGSDGEPRHWVSVKRHLEDYESVISHIQVGGWTVWWRGWTVGSDACVSVREGGCNGSRVAWRSKV